MRIYNSVTIDIATGEVLAADTEDYTGPVAECKDGGSQQNSKQSFLFPELKPGIGAAAGYSILGPLLGANFTMPQQGMGNGGPSTTSPNLGPMFDYLKGISGMYNSALPPNTKNKKA